ncbi:hypothetical protein [Winogradskyella sp.]|uniref:hypothetical protein n=1 Tax=Winogradskyella sp. TaxID=1883156 RepID=UPI003F6D8075
MKLKQFFKVLFCALLVLNMQCDEDDVIPLSDICDELIVTSNTEYENLESDFYSLDSAEIIDDCLVIAVSASGCDGNSWLFTLVDSGDIAESMPPQRNLKFGLTNNEACLAVFSREMSFDLRSLQIEGVDSVILNIEDFSTPLEYNY